MALVLKAGRRHGKKKQRVGTVRSQERPLVKEQSKWQLKAEKGSHKEVET